MLKRKAAFDARNGKSTKSSTSQSSKQQSESQPESSSAQSSTADNDSNNDNKKRRLTSSEKLSHKDISHYLNKQRTLCLSSRGISYRDRHLLSDLLDLLPHSKKENKLDTKHSLSILNELAALKNCNNILFLESRKQKDLYLWLSRAPQGPSVKFLVQNIHTMAEVKLTGNAMKYSRPLLIFDQNFTPNTNDKNNKLTAPLPLIKELLTQVIGAPKGHPKVKPFIDQCFSFFYLDGKIWLRHYQIVYQNDRGEATQGAPALPKSLTLNESETQGPSGVIKLNDSVLLVEIGPRMVLNPIRIFSGSFGGSTLWENNQFVSPNTVRAQIKAMKSSEYRARQSDKEETKQHKKDSRIQENPIDTVFQQAVEI